MSTKLRPALALLATVAAAACGSSDSKKPDYELHVPSPAWEDQIIYFVMTDRFANGDPSNDDQGRSEFDPADAAKYSGGDLRGLKDKLDYIQGLGATAVWITPPVANQWWDPLVSFGGYHGYWARHQKKVDEHLGTLDDYKALSDALHRRGMYLIQDIVPNHMGNFFTWSGAYDPANLATNYVLNTQAVPTAKPEQAPFDQNDLRDPAQRAAAIYHWTPQITNFLDPVQEKDWQISDLDDLNTENPVVRAALKDSFGYWIKEVGVDAYRVDTAKFVPHGFWNDFFHATDAAAPGILAAAASTGRDDFLAFGEVFEVSNPLDDAGEQKVASYLGTPAAPELPAVLQFPLYEEIGRVFASGGPTSWLGYRLELAADASLWKDPRRMPTFIDNHDVRRFLSIGTQKGLSQALAFLFTTPGIPVIYYGTEQAFTETRDAMFKGGNTAKGVRPADAFDTTSAFYQKLKELTALRKANPALTRGETTVLVQSETPGAFAFKRSYQGTDLLVLMNTADEPVLFSKAASGLAAGTQLQPLYGEDAPSELPTVAADGKLTLVLPGRATVVAKATAPVTPPTPGVTITVSTALDGQTFTGDVVISGTVTPADAPVNMIVDGLVNRSEAVVKGQGGAWTATLPVSLFPVGVEKHTVAFYSPFAKVSTPRYTFTSNVVFVGTVLEVDDPAGDDTGPTGKAYTYPADSTFGSQMDVTHVTAEVGVTTLKLKLTIADWTTVWNPSLGFDHVAFNIYFSVPGQAGATLLPRLNASAPPGFGWRYAQFTYGWSNAMYGSTNATADTYGPPAAAPAITTTPGAKTITFTYNKNAYGLASWAGVKVYVTTWDFDGIGASFRRIFPTAPPYDMGGGTVDCFEAGGVVVKADGCLDPRIMDEVGPITLP